MGLLGHSLCSTSSFMLLELTSSMWTGNLHRQPLSPLHRLSIYVEKTQSYSKKVEMDTAIHVERLYSWSIVPYNNGTKKNSASTVTLDPNLETTKHIPKIETKTLKHLNI